MIASSALSGQFVRFVVVGLFSTAVNYGVFLALFSTGHIHYQIASGIGFVVGLVAGYPLNKAWTYGVKGTTPTRQKVAYGIVYLVSLCLSLMFLYVAVDVAGMDARIANVFSIGLTTCTNFGGTKFLVFRK